MSALTHRRVVVSIHDVCPDTLPEVRWLLDRLNEMHLRPRSLLVIPWSRGTDDLTRFPDLCDILLDEVRQGSEIVLHGYTHQRADALRGPYMTRARAALFAHSVAEFVSIPWTEQRARLLAGRAALAAIGVKPVGFCPPGWLYTHELPDLLREQGFHFLVDMVRVVDVRTQRVIATPCAGYVGAGPVHEALVGLFTSFLAPWRARSAVVSVFLHPQHAPHRAACARTLRHLAVLLSERKPVTYGDTVE